MAAPRYSPALIVRATEVPARFSKVNRKMNTCSLLIFLHFVVISDGEHDLAQARHDLTLRTDRTTVSFLNPFCLRDLEGVQPAGDYIVETDNEVIECLSRVAYRRVAAPDHPARLGLSRPEPARLC
jgi:hypothetical protein